MNAPHFETKKRPVRGEGVQTKAVLGSKVVEPKKVTKIFQGREEKGKDSAPKWEERESRRGTNGKSDRLAGNLRGKRTSSGQ